MRIRAAEHANRFDSCRGNHTGDHQAATGRCQYRRLQRLLGLQTGHEQNVRALLCGASNGGSKILVCTGDGSLTDEGAGDLGMRAATPLQ